MTTLSSKTRAGFLSGGGEMGALIRAKDWATTPLGPVDEWPQSLRTALSILLDSGYPLYISWGREFIQLYNDAFRPILGATKHPAALGQSSSECFAEIWDIIGPMFERVLNAGETTTFSDQLFLLDRNGYLEECYFTFSYSAIRDETGQPGGIFVTCIETTPRVLGERRMLTLRELAAQATQEKSAAEICAHSAKILDENPRDFPFALLYLLEEDGNVAKLAATTKLVKRDLRSPDTIKLTDEQAIWPLGQVVKAGGIVVENTPQPVGSFSGGVWSDAAQQVFLLPLAKSGQEALAGFLVAGISPQLELGDEYRGFLELTAGHIATAIANARAYEEEKKRAEALAELDRAKTTFFSNVSHEFRTPLTLLLGPLDEILTKPNETEDRELLTIARRNGQRLLKLVNTLLDFSRIEAGRIEAVYEPVDLSAYTADLASVFRAAVEKAGLRLLIDCAPLPEPVFVDREMWEKIVLNLVSNAFKYTLEGEINVTLRAENGTAVLSVTDTGIGIPAAELSSIFNRFHRVEGARGRTHEGTGIGLTLVQELAKLHGGAVKVESRVGKGSTFTVTLPFGKTHLPPDRISGARALASTATGAQSFVEEALRWLPDAPTDGQQDALFSATDEPAQVLPMRVGQEARARIVWADDNADMRDYVRRLLAADYDVIAVADGRQALQAITLHKPDLVLADVMMPNLDGFGLLKALREEQKTASMPVILLSARAGRDARIEGLSAGADDYLIKPFGAYELLARIHATLSLAKLRREAQARAAELEAQTANILESISEAFISVDAQWQFTYWNAQAEKILGVQRQDMLGKNLWDCFPEARGTIFEQQYQHAMTERLPVKFEAYYEPLGGWYEMKVYPLNNGGLAFYFSEVTARHEAAEALAKSERRYRSLAEASSSFVWMTDGEGNVDMDNLSWHAFTGQPSDVNQEWAWLETIHPEDRERVASAWRASCESQSHYQIEYRLRRSDGVYRRVAVRGIPVLSDDGELVEWVGTCTDIDDQRRAEEQFRLLFEKSADAILIADDEGRYCEANQAACELFGYPREQLLKLKVSDLVTTDEPEAGERYQHYLKKGSESGEFAFLRPDGERRVAQYNASRLAPGRHLSILRDITEHKRIEAERERHYRDGLILTETNRALVGTFEIAQVTEIICRAARELTGADGATFVLRDGERVHYVDENAIAPLWKGQDFPIDCCISGWAMRAGRQAVITDIYHDERIPRDAYWPTFVKSLVMTPVGPVTPAASIGVYWGHQYQASEYERKLLQSLASAADLALVGVRAYDEARSARLQAEAASRLKDEFLATISHELRTPLNGILGWARLLRVGRLSAEEMRRALETIERNAQAQNRLIEDLLDISRIISGKMRLEMREVKLVPVIEAALNVVRPVAEAKGVHLQSLLDAGMEAVAGDADRLQQVIWNLLSNAIKFTPRGGEVRVQLKLTKTQAEISVSDTGAGISPEFLPYVFDRFRQADGSSTRLHGGLGLGLAIVRHLVELHGGTVQAHSAGLGQGATFTLTFPLIASYQPDVLPLVSHTLPTDLKISLDGVHVLLVDDDPSTRDLLFTLLVSKGATVSAVASAAAGLAALTSLPDIIISDIEMPEEDGYAFIRKVRSAEQGRAAQVPAIALTAYARVEDRVRAISAGYQMHVPKPVEPTELLLVIASLAQRQEIL